MITVAALTVLTAAGPAAANKFKVNTAADHQPGKCNKSDCTLREAVIKANDREGLDKVIVKASKGPYRLTRGGANEDESREGDLDLAGDSATIVGKRGVAEIRQTKGDRVLHTLDGENSQFNLMRIELSGGDVDGPGGGVLAEEQTFFSLSEIRDNRASTFGGGAGVTGSASRLNLGQSTVAGNRAGVAGGGVFISGPDGVAPTFSSTTISDNRAPSGGGAYVNLGDANWHLNAVTFAGNQATTSAGNGGGIFIAAGGGPGIGKFSHATIAANEAPAGSGHASNLLAGEAPQLENTLIAQDLGGAPSCTSDVDSLGHNFDAGTTCGLDQGTDLETAEAGLKPLADYGGPTETKGLTGESDALGEGTCPGSLLPLGVDQRGAGRPAACDIGAFERDPTSPPD